MRRFNFPKSRARAQYALLLVITIVGLIDAAPYWRMEKKIWYTLAPHWGYKGKLGAVLKSYTIIPPKRLRWDKPHRNRTWTLTIPDPSTLTIPDPSTLTIPDPSMQSCPFTVHVYFDNIFRSVGIESSKFRERRYIPQKNWRVEGACVLKTIGWVQTFIPQFVPLNLRGQKVYLAFKKLPKCCKLVVFAMTICQFGPKHWRSKWVSLLY